MSHRYVQIRENLSKVSIAKLVDLLLSLKENKQVDEVLSTMKRHKSISMKVKRDDIYKEKLRELFETILEPILYTDNCLGTDASIVENVLFEWAFLRPQLYKCNDMSPKMNESVNFFCKNIEVVDILYTSNDLGFAEIAVRKFKKKMCIKHDLINTQFLCLSSNRCKRFFLHQELR